MKKKVVLFVLATNKYSGAENVAITIINNMNDKYDFIYTSPEGEIGELLNEKGIQYVPLKRLSICNLKKVIEEVNPDIIHAHDFRASFMCSLLKNKKILISHLHNNSPWIKRYGINSFVFLYFAKKANKVLIVSDSIEKEFVFSKYINKKIICINNPVNRNNILECVKKNINSKKYDICCIARVTEQKNPQRFINVVKKVKQEKPDIQAIWVGEYSKEYKKIIDNMIKKYNLSKNINFIGFKKNPFNILKQSKVFLLTSDWEGYGLVAFEALTLGIPCVVSNVGGLKSIVDYGCGKLCEIDKIESYSKEIIKLMKDDVYYKKKSEKAIRKSIELENIELYCKKLDSIYKKEL